MELRSPGALKGRAADRRSFARKRAQFFESVRHGGYRCDHAGPQHVGPGLIRVASPGGHLVEGQLAGGPIGGGQALGVFVCVPHDVVDGQSPSQLCVLAELIGAGITF